MHELTRRIKEKALELGYARVGIAPAARYPELLEELGQRDGYERWKGDTSPFPTMADPFSVMPEAKSIISLVWSYGAVDYPETLLRHVARTYLSRSYCPPRDTSHGIRLTEFEDYLEAQGLRIVRAMNNMQTADRLTAARAGVVTFGRNNFAYAGDCGSFITLVSILTDAELECDHRQAPVPRRVPAMRRRLPHQGHRRARAAYCRALRPLQQHPPDCSARRGGPPRLGTAHSRMRRMPGRLPSQPRDPERAQAGGRASG